MYVGTNFSLPLNVSSATFHFLCLFYANIELGQMPSSGNVLKLTGQKENSEMKETTNSTVEVCHHAVNFD